MRFFCAYGTIFKIHFLCTLYIYSGLKTKDEPRTNLGTSKELPTTKKCFLTKPEKGWLDYWVVILKNVNFWLVS